MTRALVWKEVREQRAVWLALALAAAGGVAGLCALMPPGRNRDEMLTGVLWFAAWGYGLVCGALVLAGEAEEGTQAFLDALPATRRRLWRVKAGTGLALLAAQTAALGLVGFFLVRGRQLPERLAFDAAALAFCGLVGYAWGLYCGSFAANVLSAVARAVLLQALAAPVVYVFALLLLQTLLPMAGLATVPWAGLLLTCGLTVASITAGVALGSRRIYCHEDLLRAPTPEGRRAAGQARGVLFGLAWREARGFAVGAVVSGVFAALVVTFLGVAAWPVLTLAAGVLCGVTAFAGRRATDPLSDPDLPPGRVWLARAVVRLAAGVGFTAVAALGVVVALGVGVLTTTRLNLNTLENQLAFRAAAGLLNQPAVFITYWLVCGFSAGLFAGVLFRGRLAAALAAVALAVPLGLVWVPSLFVGGGLHLWQVWGVPAVLVAASRLLALGAASRSSPARLAGVTAGAATASGLWLGAALWYRTAEVAPAPDAIDVEAFRAGLPSPEENAGGLLTQSALRRLAVIPQVFISTGDPDRPRLPFPGQARVNGTDFFLQLARAQHVAEGGWKKTDARFEAWLDLMFGDSWARDLAEAADRPTGIVLDPRELNASAVPFVQEAREAATLLVARGLQRQAGGDPAAFVDNLRVGLALARNLRHRTIIFSPYVSWRVETEMLRGVELWLERLDGRPDLLRRALDVLRQHEGEPQTDPDEIRNGQLLVLCNSLDDPDNLQRPVGPNPLFPTARVETDLLRVALHTPWERARIRRLLGALASGDDGVADHAWQLSPPVVRSEGQPFNRYAFFQQPFPRPNDLCRGRAALLQVALRLYQAEAGRPAQSLADLVPKYLPTPPADPFDGQPFRYRLSRGEIIAWPYEYAVSPKSGRIEPRPESPPGRDVPAGQGILWCVGEDGRDDGGHSQANARDPGAEAREDVIFLVPLPPGGR